jgi:hypothetical protein
MDRRTNTATACDAVDGSSAGIAMVPRCGVLRTAREEPPMEEITTIGLDIAKSVFQVTPSVKPVMLSFAGS